MVFWYVKSSGLVHCYPPHRYLHFQEIGQRYPAEESRDYCTVNIFPKTKLRLKGRRFDTTEEIHAESQEIIDTFKFENFQGCMKSWETHWDRCTSSTCPRGLLRKRRWKLGD